MPLTAAAAVIAPEVLVVGQGHPPLAQSSPIARDICGARTHFVPVSVLEA